MTKAGRERLRQEFLEKTGIDLGTYRDPQIVEALVELVGFPRLLWRSVGRSILLALLVIGVASLWADGFWATVGWLGLGGILGLRWGWS